MRKESSLRQNGLKGCPRGREGVFTFEIKSESCQLCPTPVLKLSWALFI